jgi:hypothetical protein
MTLYASTLPVRLVGGIKITSSMYGLIFSLQYEVMAMPTDLILHDVRILALGGVRRFSQHPYIIQCVQHTTERLVYRLLMYRGYHNPDVL